MLTGGIGALGSLESGICPACGKPLRWAVARPIEELYKFQTVLVGDGYWAIVDT